jgi:hypothetical protein
MLAKRCALSLFSLLCATGVASACFIGCRPGEQHAQTVINHLIAKRFSSDYVLLSYQTTRTADFDMIAGEMRGYEIFFKARVQFPHGANLDCAPDAAKRADDCSGDGYFSLIRETRPTPGRQYIEPGGVRTFDEDIRFAEYRNGWKGPDGEVYQP